MNSQRKVLVTKPTFDFVTITTRKLGKFSFTSEECEKMRGMQQSQLTEKIKAEFKFLSLDDVVYVVNHIQV